MKQKKLMVIVILVIVFLIVGIRVLYEIRLNYKYHLNENGTITIDEYLGKETKVTIPEKIFCKKITEIGYRCFYKNTTIEEVIIPSTVEKIGIEAFSQCEKLKKITGGENVVDIKSAAFNKSEVLSEVFPLTKVKIIEERLFSGCINLNHVQFSENIEYIGAYVFNNTQLGYDIIPNTAQFVSGAVLYEVSEENRFLILGDQVLVRYPYEEVVEIPKGIKVISVYNNKKMMKTKKIIVPNTVEKIENTILEFADSGTIYIPESVIEIGDYTRNVYNEEKLYDVSKICGIKGSYAEDYAKRYNIPFEEVERWY